MCEGPDLFLCILAVLFPPIAVWVKRGICSADSCINLALCMLGFLPGLLHAWYIVSCYPDPGYDRVNQDGETHVVYYVQTQPSGGYGTVAPNSQFPGQQGATANAFAPPKTKGSKKGKPQPPPSQPTVPHQVSPAGPSEGSSANPDLPPPTYDDAVKGDNKVQH